MFLLKKSIIEGNVKGMLKNKIILLFLKEKEK